MRTHRVVIALGLLAVGCAQGRDLDGDVELLGVEEPPAEAVDADSELAVKVVDPDAAPARTTTCEASFKVDPRLEDMFLRQASRWSAAAGCVLDLSDDGLPVTLEPRILDDEGKEVYGKTSVLTLKDDQGVKEFYGCSSVMVSAQSPNVERTLGHELGHCLGVMGHTDDGLMRQHHYRNVASNINAAALEMLCTSVDCLAFNPER